jgi:hypothetical protein
MNKKPSLPKNTSATKKSLPKKTPVKGSKKTPTKEAPKEEPYQMLKAVGFDDCAIGVAERCGNRPKPGSQPQDPITG